MERKAPIPSEVFLSFRGPDVRSGLVAHLHEALLRVGIRVLRDDDELHVGGGFGSKFLDNLAQTPISIPIFSPNYASSKWCLRELVHILKCRRSHGQIVSPIFYEVAPSDVRHLKGDFGEDFHLPRGPMSEMEVKEWEEALREIKEWEEALREIGSLRGWETEKFGYGREPLLVKEVVRRVLSLLERPFERIDRKELVAIDDQVRDIMRLIDPKFNDTRIIGIYGRGGSGKTTLAKVLCKNLSDHFEYRSFVANIREISLRMGIEYLQEQLIYNILGSSHDVSKVDEGTHIIKSQFTNKKVLILLDDMDDNSHLEALVGDGNWFEAGSIVIITTRNESFLDNAKGVIKHELEQLTVDQALTLFHIHLSRKVSFQRDYDSIYRDVLSRITRLPTTLEVLGSSFGQKGEEVWKDALDKLSADVSNMNLKELVSATYKTLYYEQQQIFLDIACFFIGSSKQIPTYMWDACGFFPKKGIEELSSMSLIEIGKDDKLIMHDQDFGREIVRRENRREPQKRSRLWIYEEAVDVLVSNKGTSMIQAVCLDKYDSERSYTSENFKDLTKLRFLKVSGANFTGDFQNMLSELRWLQWERCPLDFAATNFHPKQLVVLNLSSSGISEDWKGWDQLKVATKLKVLNLSSCPFFSTPDLSVFVSLEILILENCENLKKIHPSIGDIKSLISLNVNGCSRVEELPLGVGRLEELKELLINDTAIREIPMSEGGLMKLETLNASGCESLKKLPTGLGRVKELRELLINDTAIQEIPMSEGGLMKLETLNASGCKSLGKLPTGLGRMEELRELVINDTPIREIPISEGGLKKLEILRASYCEELAQLSESLGSLESLTRLDLSHTGVEKLPDSMAFLTSLTQLDLSYSWIEKLPEKSLGSFRLLTQLDLSHSGIEELPESIRFLNKLTQLDLSHSGIEELPESVGYLRSLTHLDLSHSELKRLPESMGYLVSLQHLLLRRCRLLRQLPSSIVKLASLIKLDLHSTGIAELPPGMRNLKKLTFLDICGTDISRLPDQFSFALHDGEISWEQM